ncbi:MAG TPA: ABC transporter substrate-binding protein [Streptosporangiaceae bacterium]|nr:ABC transporter substrate-binding protein [Streptosporangiaceae bacterium]
MTSARGARPKVRCLPQWLTALAAVALTVPACSLTRVDAAAPVESASSLSGIGPITFATGELDTGSYLPSLLRDWNRTHPGQRVTLVRLPDDSDDQLAQLVTNLQAGSDAYDVMSLDVVWTAEFASSGWIVPLSGNLFPLGDFLRPAVDTAMYHGQLWAAPYTSNAELLYYRSDVLKRAGVKPPRTWAQLAGLAKTVAPRYKLWGYAGQFRAYEGLTVNFDEAVASAGGSILSPDGSKVTLNSPAARKALGFLVSGFQQGWIPRAALSFDEQTSQDAFERGKLLFLNNWPYVYGQASKPGPGNVVAGKFGVEALPGPDGPGSSALGGANLAISAFSRHPRTALAFIEYMTSLPVERQILIHGSLPPVWTSLYQQPSLVRKFPYLPALEKAILSARPRPAIPEYNQLSLAISSSVHRALTLSGPVSTTITQLSKELTEIVRNG